MLGSRVLSVLLAATLSLAAVVASRPAATVQAAGPIGYGIASDDNPEHLFSIDLSTGVLTDLGVTGTEDVEALTFSCNGVLFGVDDDTYELVTFNLKTGARTVIGPVGATFNHGGLAFDDQGRLWMADPASDNLYQLNPQTGAATLVGPMGAFVSGLAFGQGTLFGLDASADQLVTLNRSTGAATAVGPLGTDLDEPDLSFDSNGTLWVIDDSGSIFTINTQTGALSPVTTTSLETYSLAIDAGCGARTNSANNDDEKPKETKLQQQQRERTNRRGLDDYEVQGNVTAVGKDDAGSFLVLANRDGLVTVRLHRDAAKTKVCVGYYVQVAGEKEHELLYDAEDLSIDKKSDSKDCIN